MLEASPSEQSIPDAPAPAPPPSPLKRHDWRKWWVSIPLILIVLGSLTVWYVHSQQRSSASTAKSDTLKASPDQSVSHQSAQTIQGIRLDTKKHYGDKYADGVVPVGDNHYVTSSAKQGYIYVCSANFVPAGQAGAQTRGPWFTNSNTEYDLNKKVHVAGSVRWTPSMSNVVAGSSRTISTNDLPTHQTGVFPVSSSDPAYSYDRNPNSIKGQTLTYNLNANPAYGTPHCIGGEVGVMLTGVALFDGFDAGGRDAGAWEVQDGCDGHPQDKGEYHYHSLSSCITDIGVGTVIGFALDGFPITGPQVGPHNILTTADLDECHGLTSEITLDGKKVTTYHYVMTQDFPYSVSCFRSTAIQAPGLPEGSSQQPSPGSQQQSLAPTSGQKPPGGYAPPPRL